MRPTVFRSVIQSGIFAFLTALILATAAPIVSAANADTLLTPEQSDKAAIRLELERIVKEEPDKAAEARKTLEALDQPAMSLQGRPWRNQGERSQRIVNGLSTMRHAAVAAVLKGSDPDTAVAWCTGTLVGCNKILTAAHCVAKDPTPSHYSIFFPSLGFFKVIRIEWPKDQYKGKYADIAMLTLDRSVQGIAPILLNPEVSPIPGSIATIIGYGRTGGQRRDYGIKREGSVKLTQCTGSSVNKKLLCWDYDADIHVVLKESNTCNADSGGGVFMRDNNVQRVVGVVAGGRDANCEQDDHSYNTDVAQWQTWLTEAGQDNLSTAVCGGGDPIDAEANLSGKIVAVEPDKKEATLEVDVPHKTSRLHVAMNGEDNGTGKNDFDLFLYSKTEAGTKKAVCKQDGGGQFAFCKVPDPAVGRWIITVRQKKGGGLAQVVVTLIPSP